MERRNNIKQKDDFLNSLTGKSNNSSLLKKSIGSSITKKQKVIDIFKINRIM